MDECRFLEDMARRLAADEALALSGSDSAEAQAAKKRIVEFCRLPDETRAGVLASLAAMRAAGRI